MYSLYNQTAFHAACSGGNINAMELLLNEYDNIKNRVKNPKINLENEVVFIKPKKLTVIQILGKIAEMKKDLHFKQLNKDFRKYLKSNAKVLFYPEERTKVGLLENLEDKFGNIPINCASKYSQNKFITSITELSLITNIDKHLSKTNKSGISGYFLLKDNDLQNNFLSHANKKLYPIPLVVLELNKNPKTIASINLIMKIALSENLKVALMEHRNPNNIYLLIDIGNKEFCAQAEKEKIQMKLLDKNLKVSFMNNEEFIKNVEPFLSRHYQFIISSILSNLLDIQMLKDQKVVNKVFYTHKPNVTQKIMDEIIKRIIPNPIAFFPDYFFEGKHRIFKEIDLLYHYFGEAAATFYSFYGFITNYYIFMAIVGLIYVFIYLASLFNSNEIYPTFCIVFAIWNFVFISRWKRKNEEIHHKWGMKTKTSNREIRSEFRGDEYYKDINSPLQKHSQKYRSLKVFLGSLPLILILLAADVVVFYYTTKWEDNTEENSSLIFQYLPSIVRSIGLSIISYIYDFVANYFAIKENHKYQEVYERVLIVKIFGFRLIADLTSVLYSSLVQKNIENLKVLIYTNLIIKYLSEIGIRVCLPFVTQWFFTRQYFNFVLQKGKKYSEKYKVEKKLQNKETTKNGEGLIDNEQEKLQNPLSNNQGSSDVKNDNIDNKDIQIVTLQDAISDENIYRRVHCISGKSLKETDISSFNFNPDFIEITNMLDTRTDLIYDYADIIIVHTICSLFSILIPFGPVIVLFFSVISQNGKLYGDLYFFQRAPAKECEGIDIWLDILEIISILSVVFNCFLFYFYGSNYLTNQVISTGTEINVGTGEKSLFILVSAEHIIIIIQYLLKISIPSVPSWIQKERENLLDYYQSDKFDKESKNTQELSEEINKYQKMYLEKIKILERDCEDKDKKIRSYENDLLKYKKEIINKEEKIDASIKTINLLLGDKAYKTHNKMKFPRLRHLKSGKAQNYEEDDLTEEEINQNSPDPNLFISYKKVKNEIDVHFDEYLQKLVKEMLLSQKSVLLSEIEDNSKNTMKIYFFNLLKITFENIEKEILNLKFGKYIQNIEHPLIICDLCLEKRANYLCRNCQEMLCSKCKEEHLSNTIWSNHQLEVYALPIFSKKFENLTQTFSEKDLLYVKMENFSFPTKISKNLGYEKLNSLFEILYNEYFTKNGILKDNTVNSKNLIQIKLEFLTKLSSSPNKFASEQFGELIKNSFFNCEEFFYINRICYKIFKFYGAKSNIGMLYTTLRKFQISNFEERVLTLLNILDVYDNQTIFKSELEKFFIIVTLQNYNEKYSIPSIMDTIFPHSNFISLIDLYQIFIQDNNIAPLMKYILQCEEENEEQQQTGEK